MILSCCFACEGFLSCWNSFKQASFFFFSHVSGQSWYLCLSGLPHSIYKPSEHPVDLLIYLSFLVCPGAAAASTVFESPQFAYRIPACSTARLKRLFLVSSVLCSSTPVPSWLSCLPPTFPPQLRRIFPVLLLPFCPLPSFLPTSFFSAQLFHCLFSDLFSLPPSSLVLSNRFSFTLGEHSFPFYHCDSVFLSR